MSARTRWWLRGLLSGVIFLAMIPLYIKTGNWPAAIMAITGVYVVVIDRISARWLYQAGWYAGRVSMHLDVHDIDPEPWDDLPPRAAVTRVAYPLDLSRAPVQYAWITCPRCGRTSYHPEDIKEGYCGACEDWTTPRPPGRSAGPTVF